jgi:hypothetical protein
VTNVETNLRVLTPSRKKPKPGDLFAMRLPNGPYLHGRVIAVDLMIGGVLPAEVLIYIFRHQSRTEQAPPKPMLLPDQLLVSPIFTNRLPWSRGYFKTVANQPLSPEEVLPRHCFLGDGGRYYDEHGNQLPGPIEPCGDWVLDSYRTIDDAVSDALLIPRLPD